MPRILNISTKKILLNVLLFSIFVFVDDQAPIITALPNDITIESYSGQAYAVVLWEPPTVVDDSGYYTVLLNPISGSRFGIGSTEVMITASDQSGNIATASFFVTIEGIVLHTS